MKLENLCINESKFFAKKMDDFIIPMWLIVCNGTDIVIV